jgi:hypothetical protein
MLALLRKFTLLLILFMVAMGTYLSRQNSTDWREPLWVQLYPINGDGREATADYINKLERDNFLVIEQFMQREAQRYGVDIERPVKIVMGEEIGEQPPAPPVNGNPLQIGFWSLKLRWWASGVTGDQPGPAPDIRLFLVYFDPQHTTTVAHSLGLQKGLLGIVNIFAARRQRNANKFIIAHEMLHTLGASDKYDWNTSLPLYPIGFADPDKSPLFPQTRAEIMGGRIPLSDTDAVMPAGLKKTVVGAATALEIRWTD